jgi:hypothetical protein
MSNKKRPETKAKSKLAKVIANQLDLPPQITVKVLGFEQTQEDPNYVFSINYAVYNHGIQQRTRREDFVIPGNNYVDIFGKN